VSERSHPAIDISLISINHRAQLAQLLPSIERCLNRDDIRVLLVLNRTVDDTRSWTRSAHPTVSMTENPRVAGYGENHNVNLRRAQGKYFAIMNTDMIVSPDVFVTLHRFMEENPQVGVVVPKVLNEDGSIQGLNKRYPSVFDLFLRLACPSGLSRFFRRRLDRYEMRDRGYETQYDVPVVSGSFMFCRTEVLRSLGGFDEEFFLYFEDFDLCRRIQQTHRTTYCPATWVIHFWERSAHKDWRFAWRFTRSAMRYFRKWGWKLT